MLLVIEVGNTNTGIGRLRRPRACSCRGGSRAGASRPRTSTACSSRRCSRTRGIEPQHITGRRHLQRGAARPATLEWMSERVLRHPARSPWSPASTSTCRSNVDHPQRGRGRPRVQRRGRRRALRRAAHRRGLRHRHQLRRASTRGASSSAGAIAPGLMLAAEALVSRAARLSRVELVRPKDAIGRNTVTNIQSGVDLRLRRARRRARRAHAPRDRRRRAGGRRRAGFAEQMREVVPEPAGRSTPT